MSSVLETRGKSLLTTSLYYRPLGLAVAVVLAMVNVSLDAQNLYNLGGSNTLQKIDINSLEVTDLCVLNSVLSDIAFDPQGALYGVEQHTLYLVDSVSGELNVVKTFPPSLGWLTGLAIDAKGRCYFSSTGAGEYHLLTYDPIVDEVYDHGPLPWRHWDVEFYDGELFASGGTEQLDLGFLIHVNMDDLQQSQIVLEYGMQSYGLFSFNEPCGSVRLIAPSTGSFNELNIDESDVQNRPLSDPSYSVSAGAASRTSWLGSLPPIEVEGASVGPISCAEDESTFITVNVTTSRPGVMFSLDGGAFQTSNILEGAGLGTHVVVVKDTYGCEIQTDPIRITAEFDPEGSVATEPAHCNEDNGSITYSPSTSSESYSYILDSGELQTTPVFVDLSAGDHELIIINEHGCSAELMITVPVVEPLVQEFHSAPEHCGFDDGRIEVVTTGGEPPYQYALGQMIWRDEPLFENLHASNYLVRTRDSKGCVVERSITVDSAAPPQILSISIRDAACNREDGIATIETNSSTDAINFSLSNGLESSFGEFADLAPGQYEVIVSDTFGCTSTEEFSIENIPGPEIEDVQIVQDDCHGGNGQVSVVGSGGLGDLEYSINGIDFQPENVFGNLSAGTFELTVQDDNSCIAAELVEVGKEEGPRIVDLSITEATCEKDNGRIEVTSDVPGVQYSINGADYQSNPMFESLPQGSYSVYVRDDLNCQDSSTVLLNGLPMTRILAAETGDEECTAQNGWIDIIPNEVTAQFSLNGGAFSQKLFYEDLTSGTYTIVSSDNNGCSDTLSTIIESLTLDVDASYVIEDSECQSDEGRIVFQLGEGVSISVNGNQYSDRLIYDQLEPGVYELNFKDDKGCSSNETVLIDTYGCAVFVPNVFTPNGDGQNDILQPVFDIAEYDLVEFVVADRTGAIVFSCTDGCSWDGTIDGQQALPGVYAYRVLMESIFGEVVTQSGDVTILR